MGCGEVERHLEPTKKKVFGKSLNILWQIPYAIRQVLNALNGEILKKLSSHLVTLFLHLVTLLLSHDLLSFSDRVYVRLALNIKHF